MRKLMKPRKKAYGNMTADRILATRTTAQANVLVTRVLGAAR